MCLFFRPFLETIITSSRFPHYKQNKNFNVCLFYICISVMILPFFENYLSTKAKTHRSPNTPHQKISGNMKPVINYKVFRTS